jgi:hypothetical protein
MAVLLEQPTAPAATHRRDSTNGSLILAVGVGGHIDNSILEVIAGNPNNVFVQPNGAVLDNALLNQISNRVCTTTSVPCGVRDLPLNVVISFDGSGSVERAGWQQQVDFITNFTNTADSKIKLAVSWFGKECNRLANFTTPRDDIRRTLQGLRNYDPYQGTRIFSCIEDTFRVISESSANAETTALVLITDGRVYQDENVTYSHGTGFAVPRAIRQTGTRTYAIGVQDVNQTRLTQLLGDNTANSYLIEAFSGLSNELARRLSAAVCVS